MDKSKQNEIEIENYLQLKTPQSPLLKYRLLKNIINRP